MSEGSGHGRGKVILLGEHAVVYGHPALAGALTLGVTAKVRPAEKLTLRVPSWDLDTAAEPTGRAAQALEAVARTIKVVKRFHIDAEAAVPPRAGLGSSAALCVAVARALYAAKGRVPDDAQVEEAATAGERVFHGNPSGVDVSLATRGGLGLFRRGAGLKPVSARPFRLAIGLSGVARDTAARVADVARRREDNPRATSAILYRLGELAHTGAGTLVSGRAEALGPLFDEAHSLLAALGLSSEPLHRLCQLAREAGASGAKLTGAGGGGAVIAVGNVDHVVDAWRKSGFVAFAAEVGTT